MRTENDIYDYSDYLSDLDRAYRQGWREAREYYLGLLRREIGILDEENLPNDRESYPPDSDY